MNYFENVIKQTLTLLRDRQQRRRLGYLWDEYKLDSVDFIKREPSSEFLWPLDELQYIREYLKHLENIIESEPSIPFSEIEKEPTYRFLLPKLEHISNTYPNYNEFPFFVNLKGLVIFSQQLFRITHNKTKDREATRFIKQFPILISAYVRNPASLIFVGREITPLESKDHARLPKIEIEDDKIYIIYPKFSTPSKILTAIRAYAKAKSISTIIDVTNETILLETNPGIINDFRQARETKKAIKITLPGNCNPNIMLALLNDITKS